MAPMRYMNSASFRVFCGAVSKLTSGLSMICWISAGSRREVAVDLGTAGDHRCGGIRMRHRHGQGIQAIPVLLAKGLGGGVLQEARLHRAVDRRHGDAVLGGEVGQGLNLRIVGDQVVGKGPETGHGLDVLPTMGAVPEGEQRPEPGGADVHRAR